MGRLAAGRNKEVQARLFDRLSGEELLEYAGQLRGLPGSGGVLSGCAAAGRAGPGRGREAAGRGVAGGRA